MRHRPLLKGVPATAHHPDCAERHHNGDCDCQYEQTPSTPSKQERK